MAFFLINQSFAARLWGRIVLRSRASNHRSMESSFKLCYAADMTITHDSIHRDDLVSIDQFIEIAEQELRAEGKAAFAPEEKQSIRRKLHAVYLAEPSLEPLLLQRAAASVAPWKQWPKPFNTRVGYLHHCEESSETSAFYEFIPRCSPLEKAESKVRGLAQARFCYPID